MTHFDGSSFEAAARPTIESLPIAETLHRVANNLTLLAASLRVARRQVTDPVARAALDSATARIEAMGQVHRQLYALPPQARIDLTAFLGGLAPIIGASIGMTCAVSGPTIGGPTIGGRTIGGPAIGVSGRTAESLAVVMTELAINAFKHGYDGEAGQGIEARVGEAGDGWMQLTVRDRGHGLPDGFRLDGGRGLGLRIVASAVESLGGRIRTFTDGGAHFVVEAPPS